MSGSWDNTGRVWDAASGAELAVLRGHERGVTSVSYSPDGARIVSGSVDKALGSITTHPSGHAWAGHVDKHLTIIQLEGVPDQP